MVCDARGKTGAEPKEDSPWAQDIQLLEGAGHTIAMPHMLNPGASAIIDEPEGVSQGPPPIQVHSSTTVLSLAIGDPKASPSTMLHKRLLRDEETEE